MIRLTGGQRTTNVTDNQAPIEIINGEAFPVVVKQIEIFNGAATACKVEFGRPAAKGVTPTTPVALQPESPASTRTSLVTTALAWGTSPTPPTIAMRRGAVGATVGGSSRIVWDFPEGISLAPAETLVISNDGAGQVLDVNVIVEHP